ncbi:MAG: hypothetical protein K5765_06330 [Clostridia bacterium]|nr:hypothetical protein [Clostridia bacterium]
MRFKKYVRNCLRVLPKNVNTCYLHCRDNYVGTISKSRENLFILKELRYENKKYLYGVNSNKKRIIILLESPHINEFNRNLIAPALGTTGEKLHLYLHKLLYNNGLLNETEYCIFLVNAIAYQTSLGFATTIYRDKIFRDLWEKNSIKNSLIRRINRINPSIIINASTAKFKKMMTKFLKEKFQCDIWEADKHPFVWNNKTSIEKR